MIHDTYLLIKPKSLLGHAETVSCFAELLDGTLISGSMDETLKLWRDGKCIYTLESSYGYISGVFVLKNGTLVMRYDNGIIDMWKCAV